MKSQSVSGPHRVTAAELHPVVDVLARGEALLVHPDRCHQVRDQQHVDDEPGAVLGLDRRLPSRSTNRLRRCRACSALVSSATTTSTSFITGTGEKKCSPSIRSGRRIACASSAIGIEDVFEATIASSDDDLGDRAHDLELQVLVLGHGLDHEAGARRSPRARVVSVDPLARPACAAEASSLPPRTARASEVSIRSRPGRAQRRQRRARSPGSPRPPRSRRCRIP